MEPRQSLQGKAAQPRPSVQQKLPGSGTVPPRPPPPLVGVRTGDAAPRPAPAGAHDLVKNAPTRWKAPVAKIFALKAAKGSSLNASDLVEPAKKGKRVIRWHLGYIYAGCGMVDLVFRVTGLILWQYRFNTSKIPRVSDTQREDIGQPIDYEDMWRLVLTGSSAVIRCAANFMVLWHAFALFRPTWNSQQMRHLKPVFKVLLLLWILADFVQACIPNVPPDPTDHTNCTPHIVAHQVVLYSSLLANLILLYVLYHDRDASDAAVMAAVWTWLTYLFTVIYYSVHLFQGHYSKSTPMGWGLVVETSFLMLNVGLALPPRIVAIPAELDKKLPRFLREGKPRENEDLSGTLSGDKALILSGPEVPEMEIEIGFCSSCSAGIRMGMKFCAKCGAPVDAPASKEAAAPAPAPPAKKRLSQDERLQKQREELAALNAQLRAGQGTPTQTRGGYRSQRKPKESPADAQPPASAPPAGSAPVASPPVDDLI